MPTRRVLTIDPGRACLAYAIWENGSLDEIALSRTDPTCPLGYVAEMHAYAIPKYGYDEVVVEQMRHYPGQSGARRDAVANDLLDLQAIGGYVAGLQECPVIFVCAADWKGQVPKKVTEHRVRNSLGVLEMDVLRTALGHYPKSLHHNLYDVIGIGLWYLRKERKAA